MSDATPNEFVNPDPLYTPPAAARYLDMSRQSLDRLAAEGMIHPTRTTPRSVRYRRSELERYLRAMTGEE